MRKTAERRSGELPQYVLKLLLDNCHPAWLTTHQRMTPSSYVDDGTHAKARRNPARPAMRPGGRDDTDQTTAVFAYPRRWRVGPGEFEVIHDPRDEDELKLTPSRKKVAIDPLRRRRQPSQQRPARGQGTQSRQSLCQTDRRASRTHVGSAWPQVDSGVDTYRMSGTCSVGCDTVTNPPASRQRYQRAGDQKAAKNCGHAHDAGQADRNSRLSARELGGTGPVKDRKNNGIIDTAAMVKA